MKRPSLRSTLWASAGAVAASILLVGPARSDTTFAKAPAGSSSSSSGTSALAMSTSAACDGVRDLMVDTLVYQSVLGYGYGYGYGYGWGAGYAPVPEAAAMEDGARAAQSMSIDSTSAGGGGGGDYNSGPSYYTGTNTQEKGVDEGDIVKTDGKYVYTLHNNELVIAKTWPVEKTAVASRLQFQTIQPQSMYLLGDKVVLQGYAIDQTNSYYGYSTRVMVVNVADRTAPQVARTYDLDGYSMSSRVVGNDLYLVQQGQIQAPQALTELAQKTIAGIPRVDQQSLRPWEVQSKIAATLRKTLLAKLTQADIEAALPKVKSGGKTFAMACSDLYVPSGNAQFGLTSVTRLGIGTKSIDTVAATLAGGQIYASTDAIYVTAPSYDWTNQGYANYGTQIHKFSIADGRPSYIASGKVDGALLNQFSMSEYKGDLRIATTDWNWNGQGSQESALYVLRPRGKVLSMVGSVKGMGKGEQIYAGRMFGERGYIVTFRQTDPLYTLDLSDPTNPKVVGELKVNGFSNYIHPMGNNLLLTIGQDATDQGRVTGMHLQVFDVSDAANPKRKFQEKMSTTSQYSWSAAQYDHHAFTYDPISGTLAIPLMEYDNNQYKNGMVVYDVDKKKGFTKLGNINHGDLADAMLQKQCADAKAAKNGNDQYYCGKDNIKAMRGQYGVDRSFVIDKYLLTTSQLGLALHELADLDGDADAASAAAALSWIQVEKTTAQLAK
jgi:hypothetical protein